jgi:photosystem II stability/assembly factor-like uncharacterized protein
VNAVVVDARGTRDTLYAGVDGGVYVSRDEGASWRRYGHGLPHASAKALDINTDLGVLVVGLNGRSAWRIRIADPNPYSQFFSVPLCLCGDLRPYFK